MDRFTAGVDADPQHHALLANVMATREWLARGGPSASEPLSLIARHELALLERTLQPTLPGPLPADFAEWTPAAPPRPVPPIRPEEIAAYQDRRRRLTVVGQRA
jgi:hypothetical protein